MASRDRMDLLRSFLGTLPPGMASNVARAVEIDRMNNGHALPHDLILDSLRPTLRDAQRSERANTPMRIFCRPFEDMLTNEPRHQKGKGRIARSSITPVWNWLAHELMPETLNAFALTVKTAAMGLRSEELQTRTVEFWTASADALRNKLSSESGRKAARLTLGSEAAMEDAREIALLLSAGQEICELQDQLPRTISTPGNDVMQVFLQMQEQLGERMPQAAVYLPLVVMKRLENPWEALRLPFSGAQAADGADMETGLVGEVLFSAIEANGAAVLAAMPNQFNADALLAHLKRFTALSNGVVKEVELRRDGVWGQRLVKDRAAVAEVMDGFMERAAKEIFAALPMHNPENGPKAPDMSTHADPEKCDRALSYARLVSGCRSLAAEASFSASLKRADEEIAAGLHSYNQEIVSSLRDVDEETRINAEQFAALATELTTILLGPEESEYIRRNSRAAVSSIAA